MNPLFPQLPEDISELTAEELTEFRRQVAALTAQMRDGTLEIPEGMSDTDVFAAATAAVADSRRAQEALATMAAAEAAGQAEIERLAAEAEEDLEPQTETETPQASADETDEPADDEPEETDETPQAEADTAEVEDAEPEPVAASAAPRLRRRPIPSASRERELNDGGSGRARVVASETFANAGVRAGQELDRLGLGRALADAMHLAGPGSKKVVAQAHMPFPTDRQLDQNDRATTWQRIQEVVGMRALVASGGICAPPEPLYDSIVYGVADRPVRDSLPSFQATRGGITFPPPLSLADARAAITRVTAEEDATPGSATKNCLTLECDDFDTATVDAIAGCIEIGNFNALTWPERVAEFTDYVAIAHAENGEVGLLDSIGDGSTAVTDVQVYGAVSTLLQGILKAAANYRSRHRMRGTTPLRVLLPEWVPELLVADIAHGQFDRFVARSRIEAILGAAGVNVTFYLDGETGASQVAGAQAAGTLNDFATTVVWYLYLDGTWLYLDRGRLDIGVIRDSTLVSTNDYQVFYETFEGIAKIGAESLKVTSTVCPDGTYAPAASAITC